MEQNRVLKGASGAGQFAPMTHAEPIISLGSRISESQLRDITNLRQDEGATFIDLTEYQLDEVRGHIDRTGDFSHTAVRKAAEVAYFEEHRFTADEHREFVSVHGDTSAYFGDPNALRRDIEQMRKDKANAIPSTSDRKQP